MSQKDKENYKGMAIVAGISFLVTGAFIAFGLDDRVRSVRMKKTHKKKLTLQDKVEIIKSKGATPWQIQYFIKTKGKVDPTWRQWLKNKGITEFSV